MSKKNNAYCKLLNKYEHFVKNGVQYVYIWNNKDYVYPVNINKDFKKFYTREQREEIDNTLINFPLIGYTFFDEKCNDCLNLEEIDKIFRDYMTYEKRFNFLLELKEIKVPEKYLRMYANKLKDEIKSEFKRKIIDINWGILKIPM